MTQFVFPYLYESSNRHQQQNADIALPHRYVPSDNDILCGRGKLYSKHLANCKFSASIRANAKRYAHAPKRIDKSLVVSSVVSKLQDAGLRFIKQDRKSMHWFVLNDDAIHEKTGHAIRDLLKNLDEQDGDKQAIGVVKKKKREQRLTTSGGGSRKNNKNKPREERTKNHPPKTTATTTTTSAACHHGGACGSAAQAPGSTATDNHEEEICRSSSYSSSLGGAEKTAGLVVPPSSCCPPSSSSSTVWRTRPAAGAGADAGGTITRRRCCTSFFYETTVAKQFAQQQQQENHQHREDSLFWEPIVAGGEEGSNDMILSAPVWNIFEQYNDKNIKPLGEHHDRTNLVLGTMMACPPLSPRSSSPLFFSEDTRVISREVLMGTSSNEEQQQQGYSGLEESCCSYGAKNITIAPEGKKEEDQHEQDLLLNLAPLPLAVAANHDHFKNSDVDMVLDLLL